jgi:transcriptional regulator with XRE-family HTH domain
MDRARPPATLLRMMPPTRPVGDLLREWRQQRRMSQLALALDANISTKHISFVESGRTAPSRDMVLTLAEVLEVPLRGRNALLLAAGFAPVYSQHALDDPALAGARRAIDLVLAGHEPYPAIAVDRHWTMVAANRATGPLTAGVAPALLARPANALRVSLHPDGLAPRIANLSEWRAHVLHRLRQQVESSADPVLEALYRELGGDPSRPPPAHDHGALVATLRLHHEGTVLSFLTTTTVFGTPIDITLSELAIESFFPADAATAEALRRAAAAATS